MKSSEILREARKLIEGGRAYYVCLAIAQVGYGRHLRERILDSIAPYSSVEAWIGDQIPEASRLAATVADFRAYRLAWIDWMIEGYEAIGD